MKPEKKGEKGAWDRVSEVPVLLRSELFHAIHCYLKCVNVIVYLTRKDIDGAYRSPIPHLKFQFET